MVEKRTNYWNMEGREGNQLCMDRDFLLEIQWLRLSNCLWRRSLFLLNPFQKHLKFFFTIPVLCS